MIYGNYFAEGALNFLTTFPRALIVRSIVMCTVSVMAHGSMVDILQVSGSRIQGLGPASCLLKTVGPWFP